MHPYLSMPLDRSLAIIRWACQQLMRRKGHAMTNKLIAAVALSIAVGIVCLFGVGVHSLLKRGVVQKVLFPGYTGSRQSRASQGFLCFECYPDLNHATEVLDYVPGHFQESGKQIEAYP
jgi:hypothetical protein